MPTHLQAFQQWLETPLGRAMLKAERDLVKSAWEKPWGEYLLILGNVLQMELAAESVNRRKLVVFPHAVTGEVKPDIYAEYEALPVAPDSIDAFLLPHTLEFTKDPYQVLREVSMALKADGYLLIMGFNPFSLWGLRHFFSLRSSAPWFGIFHYAWRVKDWLRVLNFNVVEFKRACYRPPMTNNKIFKKLKFLESVGNYCYPMLGGLYVIVAQKKTFGVTPLKLRWKKIPNLVRGSIVKPVTREMRCEQDR